MSVMTRQDFLSLPSVRPAEIFSQGVSEGFPLAFWQTTGLPSSIPVEPAPPVFRSEVERLDLFRVLMLVLGVVIGVKVLR